MGSNLLLDSIIQKIVAGRSDWTLEELQYHKNNPQEIEVALARERLRVPIHCSCGGIMIVPCSWNILMLQLARKHLKKERFLSASEAVALAIYHNVDIDGYICIITDDTVSIEIGLYNLGNGVFEAISTRWLSTKEQDRLPKVCDTMLRDLNLTGKIAQIIFARTTPDHITMHNLERVFQRSVLQVGNLTELCNMGAFIYQGILQGEVRNVLLMQIIPQSIGISDSDGAMLTIIQKEAVLPVKITKTVYVFGSELSILQGNNAVASDNAVIFTLHFQDSGETQRRQVSLTIAISVNYSCRIEAEDVNTGEKIVLPPV